MLLLSAVVAVLLAGCGGGGGASPSPLANAPPVADAGADQSVEAGAQVSLTGSGEDRDGSIASWRWSQVSGPRVNLTDATAAGTEFVAPEFVQGNARLVFRLTVTDDDGAAGQDEVAITIMPPPAVPRTYPDGPQLPADTAVPTPWHMTNVWMKFDRAPATFESFCITFRIEGEVDPSVNLYFSPFNSTLNLLAFYGGVQTRIDGRDSDHDFVTRRRGAIFSRWQERDSMAIARAPGGLVESAGHEGDFISVRNDFSWNEGRYRLCLRKSDRIEGSPLPANYAAADIGFAWGRYEHTWVRMEATDLDAGATTFVGALAVPGRTLALGEDNAIFVEIYALPSPFPAERVPDFTITVEEFTMDGARLPYREIRSVSNPTPETGDEPNMIRVSFDAADRSLILKVGRFSGRFGKVTHSLLPARPAVESASLVTVGGDRFIRAVWAGRMFRAADLPAGRINLRAELVDPSAVGSVRLRLDGPVTLTRLTGDAPYLLSAAGDGFTLSPGNYTLTITPYPESGGAGSPGVSLTARFSAAAGSSSAVLADGALQARIEAALGIPLSPANVDAAMKRLTRLEARGGTIERLEGLEKAANLRSLRLTGQRISDLSPLMRLRQLTVLDVSGNRIRTIAPLADLEQLRELDISRNEVDSLVALANLTRLQLLDVSRNRVESVMPLGGLTDLAELDISRNRVASIAPLSGLLALVRLDASYNRAADLRPLAGLYGLEDLELRDNRIVEVYPLAGLARLSRLSVGANRIGDFSPLEPLAAGGLQIVGRGEQLPPNMQPLPAKMQP